MLATAQSRTSITVVVPMRNEADSILALLSRLTEQTLPPAEILVVDAGSDDAGPDLVRGHFAVSVRVVATGPAYPGAARNHGIAAARHDWVALVDAGCLPERDWLAQLQRRAALAGFPTALIAGGYDPVVLSEWDAAQALCLVAPRDADGLRGASTASLLLDRRAWQAVGGFREDLRAAEDLVFFRTAAAMGIPCLPAPEALVRWQLAPNLAACWRRLKSYSYHHARSGLAGRWHVRVMAMDIAFALLLGAAWFWPPAGALALGLAALRVLRTVTLRRRNVPSGAYRAGRVLRVALLLALADAAVWSGAVRALRNHARSID